MAGAVEGNAQRLSRIQTKRPTFCACGGRGATWSPRRPLMDSVHIRQCLSAAVDALNLFVLKDRQLPGREPARTRRVIERHCAVRRAVHESMAAVSLQTSRGHRQWFSASWDTGRRDPTAPQDHDFLYYRVEAIVSVVNLTVKLPKGFL
ncbi:hypothetical protein NDU88_005830 [Pleurodeles waltl]|uniref:Uncharacterized protein n=1 Tax=Pleurodeles waltl TaxID=8319 RepID=A0AAV7L477_PLEWA|nr:hypothetical protein NDU88_005830 [Pleurodeles waltl]